MDKINKKITLNKQVFFPPIIFLILTIIYSLSDNEGFIDQANTANQWVLHNFGWLFTWSSFLFVVLLCVVYFSPLATQKIGGTQAEPVLTKWKWFAISLCTTVATGILFWGTAEPLYHLHAPPNGLNITQNSEASAQFAMSTMFMHWTFTPYSIYTICGLVFAISYYNYKQAFSIQSLLYPLLGEQSKYLGLGMDIICLYGLIAGMSASLGTGIYALMGGIETIFGIKESDAMLGMIGLLIVATFIVSAVSGLQRGISVLSDWNIRGFFLLALFVFLFGPTLYLLQMGMEGLGDYVYHFLPRSTNINSNLEMEWQYGWTVFYLANWFAWAPIATLFLGRIAVGYTVRDFIHFNLILPCIFSAIWLTIFSASALYYDILGKGNLYEILTTSGEQNVMYAIFAQLPIGTLISLFALIMVFVSYVTAADSNTSAMSAMSTTGISPENPEAPIWIKIVWGSLIGLISWIMITSAGIEGVKLLSVLGGFPALFLVIAVALGLVRILLKTWFKF